MGENALLQLIRLLLLQILHFLFKNHMPRIQHRDLRRAFLAFSYIAIAFNKINDTHLEHEGRACNSKVDVGQQGPQLSSENH